MLVAVNRNPNGQGTLADFTDWSQKLGLPNPFAEHQLFCEMLDLN